MRQQTREDYMKERQDRGCSFQVPFIPGRQLHPAGGAWSAGRVRCSQTHPSPPARPDSLSNTPRLLSTGQPWNACQGPAERPWHQGDRCLSGNGRAPAPVAHGSTGNAGENGCSHYSPSVLINFIPSSMLIIDNLVGRYKFPNSSMQAAP